ncbi:hypothetical protein CHELA20_52089 [Hyphomicrobiales bacterium]|nr:hypothetical protein CHELA41_22830 [Hyphomicrobiales bacterium]CAH1680530.1 hypothetical protein CHELA20_52089 [Hyphomicrobiales bacterium]
MSIVGKLIENHPSIFNVRRTIRVTPVQAKSRFLTFCNNALVIRLSKFNLLINGLQITNEPARSTPQMNCATTRQQL